MRAIAERGGHLDEPQCLGGFSLLFAAGSRPVAADVEQILGADPTPGLPARISFRAPEEDGWIELLSSGLTFDLCGLAPAAACPVWPSRHRFGLGGGLRDEALEAVWLVPGPHIAGGRSAGGRAIMPVVRTLAGLAAHLALPLAAKAVCWQPAGSWMEPGYFARLVFNWLSGGAFPALGLTALEEDERGGVVSRGLGYFAGQEIALDAVPGESPADVAKLAMRIIDHIIRAGPVRLAQELKGPSGEILLATPSPSGDRVRIERAA